jgi:hypothetical protein
MLTQLSIRDVVLIDLLELDFGPGLGVLTGETGAGKSILLDALGLALGMRADSGLVRAGQGQAAVSVAFEVAADHPALGMLEENGLAREPGEPLVIRRITSGSRGSPASPFSSSKASAGWSLASSKPTLTAACAWPLRTRPLSARLPRASPSASSRIDLPAPVSPVSTDNPAA